jgi:hypothetical protein
MAKLKALYDEDFVRWTEEQAAALRRAKSLPPAGTRGSNLLLDWENLAEEIESLGKSDRRELRSQITWVPRHLLKLDVSPAAELRAGWRATSKRGRNRGSLRDSPSLVARDPRIDQKQIHAAARLAVDDLARRADEAVRARLKEERGGRGLETGLNDPALGRSRWQYPQTTVSRQVSASKVACRYKVARAR